MGTYGVRNRGRAPDAAPGGPAPGWAARERALAGKRARTPAAGSGNPGAARPREQLESADWMRGLARLSVWARRSGLPVRAGTSELLLAGVGSTWGWGRLPEELAAALATGRRGMAGPPALTGAWVLRVPPGCGPLLRERIGADPALVSGAGNPWIHIEETALAHLPAEVRPGVWPSPEAWIRAGQLLAVVEGGVPLVGAPQDFPGLVRALGRAVAPDRVPLATWDRWRAATAWARDRGAFWLARHAAGFASPAAEREWSLRARDWGLAVRRASPDRPVPCAARQGRGIRREPARLRSPVSGGATGVLGRARAVASRLGRLTRKWLRSPVRRAPLRIRSGGGDKPFLPHTVIAHNPRPCHPPVGSGAR